MIDAFLIDNPFINNVASSSFYAGYIRVKKAGVQNNVRSWKEWVVFPQVIPHRSMSSRLIGPLLFLPRRGLRERRCGSSLGQTTESVQVLGPCWNRWYIG